MSHSRKLGHIASLAAILSAALLSASASPATSGCSSTPADRDQVVEVMGTMYAAATADELAKYHTVAAPDFYVLDGGSRYDGDTLMNMIKTFHDKGIVLVWNVTQPHVESDCHLAWITFINSGSMRDASGTKSLSWLESAVLQKESGVWRIRFFDSTRVP